MDIWALLPFRTLSLICLLWIRPTIFNPSGSYRVFRKTFSIVRSVIIFGGFALIASGYFGGGEIGERLNQAILTFRFGQWWTTIIVATLVVLVSDLGSGVLQILIPSLDRK